jgi:thiamine kinase-like enzyme
MLSPLEADVVRRDRELPGLATLLDAEAFAGALARSCPGVNVHRADLTWTAYRPHAHCVVGYRLTVDGQAVDAYARAYRTDEQQKLLHHGSRKATPGLVGRGRIAWEECAIVVSIFPNDARLPGLRQLSHRRRRGTLLQPLIPWDGVTNSGTLETLRYKPQRRYVGRLAESRAEQSRLLKVKLYTSADWRAAQQNALAFTSRGPLRTARCLGAHNRVVGFEWLTGEPLTTALQSCSPERLMRLVGAALAEVHAQEPAGLSRLARHIEAATLIDAAHKLAFLCPRIGRQSRRLAARLASWLARRPPVDRPIHGDFHAKQVLVDGETIIVLDFDRAARGDPATDIGLFGAHLEHEALNHTLAPHAVESLWQWLGEGYRLTAGCLPSDLNLYRALGLVRVAVDCYRHREPNWPERIEQLLAHAEAMAAHGERRFVAVNPQHVLREQIAAIRGEP